MAADRIPLQQRRRRKMSALSLRSPEHDPTAKAPLSVREISPRCQHWMRDHPIPCLSAAVAMGIITGIWMKRR